MAGEVLQFMRVLRLKSALQATTRDPVFVGYKRFQFVVNILNCDEFWSCLYAVIQACYPIFRILRLADMKIGGMDKLYFYVRQTDRLLQPALENVVKRWTEPRMPVMDIAELKLTKADKQWMQRKFVLRRLFHLMLLLSQINDHLDIF
jgi:hypothetical protein